MVIRCLQVNSTCDGHDLWNAKLTSFSRSYIEDQEVLTTRSIWTKAISIESIRKLPVPQTGINVKVNDHPSSIASSLHLY
jgi:hypothetical protein